MKTTYVVQIDGFEERMLILQVEQAEHMENAKQGLTELNKTLDETEKIIRG